MIAKGSGLDVERWAASMAHQITQQLDQDAAMMKEVYLKRQADEKHMKAWETVKMAKDRATEIRRRLLQLARQAAAMRDAEVTLSEEECALFAFRSEEK